MKKISIFLFLCLLLVVAAVISAGAQEANGRIIGIVTDQQGAVVPEAEVKVIDVQKLITHTTTTDKDGSYQVLSLPIGEYKVQVTKQGFKTTMVAGQHLQINQSMRVDVQLAVGTQTTEVEVTGTAAQVETVNPTVGASVTGDPIENMPLNGRNMLDLALLQPGVTEVDNPSNTGAGRFSIAGGRSDSVSFLLDGGNNNSLLDNGVVLNPNPDAIAEFRVLENNYTAEYGRNAGGIVSIVTRSGTNQWHGGAYDYLRNDWLDANNSMQKRQGQPRQVLKRNQFGSWFGGPIIKDKSFFFLNYQGQRQVRDTTVGLQEVPTEAELNGDFSHSVDGGPDPYVADFLLANPFYQADPEKAALAIIDPTRFDPITKKIIGLGLIPTSETGLLAPQGPETDNRDEATGKFDFNFNDNNRLQLTLGANWRRQNTLFDFATVNGFPNMSTTKSRFLSVSYTHIFSPTVLNVARVTAQRQIGDQGAVGRSLPTPAELGFTGVIPDSPTGPPDIWLYDTNLSLGFSYQGPAVLVNNTFEYADDLIWSKGKHNLKFGAYFSPYQNNQVFNFIPNGIFTFYGLGGFYTQNVFADFLLGLPLQYQQGPNAPSNIRSKSFAVYGQDEWKINKRLVLTLGLRYEYNTPKSDTMGRTYSVMPGMKSTVFPNAPMGLVFPGDKGAPRGVNFPDRNDFAPRFGFAFDPLGNGKMSFRGGFGIFYDILKAEDNFQFNGTAPWYAMGFMQYPSEWPGNPTSQPTYFADPFGTVGYPNPFPSKPISQNVDFTPYLPWSPITTIDPHLRTPYVYQYNLSMQTQVAKNLTAEIGFVGSTARKLTGLQDINPFILGATPSNRLLDAMPGTQPISADQPTYNIIQEFRNVGVQSYSSMQAALKKEVGDTPLGSVYFTLGYTWAHNLDNESGFRQRNSVVPYYNAMQFYGNSDIDVRHRITFSAGWDLPFDKYLGGPKALTKGWSIYPILTYRTGFPLDIYNTYNTDLYDPGPSGAGDGGLVRANLVGPSVVTLNPWSSANYANLQFLDPNNFEAGNVTSGYGTLGRNAVPGLSRFNLDMSVGKSFPIFKEKVTGELRGDFFNVFNLTQFRRVNTTIGSDTFGQITDTYDPRIVQIALKVRF